MLGEWLIFVEYLPGERHEGGEVGLERRGEVMVATIELDGG